MSDGRIKLQDMARENQRKYNTAFLRNLSVTLLNTDPDSPDVDDLKWLFSNKSKIIRNKKLIDLIG